MSQQYNAYLVAHESNVLKAYGWLRARMPQCIDSAIDFNIRHHDSSKLNLDEYEAYDNYFYGMQKTQEEKDAFNRAWLRHIHRNPHHWQYWVLLNDVPGEGEIVLEMPYKYIIEMICDWWSFGWKNGNLRELFSWYAEHKDHMKLHNNTRSIVEAILDFIKERLDTGF